MYEETLDEVSSVGNSYEKARVTDWRSLITNSCVFILVSLLSLYLVDVKYLFNQGLHYDVPFFWSQPMVS